MVEAILWDNDGVLVDTERLFFQSTRETLARAGVELTLEQFLDLSMRQGRSTFDLVAECGWNPQRIAALKKERDTAYADILRNETRIMAGIPEALRALQSRARMAVVTSSQREHFEVMHASTRLTGFFEFVLAREDFNRTKPHPEPYLLALRRLGLAPERCIAIEDSERGLAAARAAGLRCLVIPNEITCACNFDGATAVLQSAAQVPETLETL